MIGIDYFSKKWKRIPKEAKASAVYTVGSIIQKCLSFLTLPLFIRLLSKKQYGQVTIYNSWYSLLVIALTLQLPYGSFSKAMVKFEKQRDEYISSVQGICILLTAVFLIIYFSFLDFWNQIFELSPFTMIMMVVHILTSSAFLFWCGKKRFEYRYVEVFWATIAISILSIIVQFVWVSNTSEKDIAYIGGSVFGSFVIGGAIFIKNIVNGKKIYDKVFWKYALDFNLPLLIYYISQMIFNTSDRIMISHLLGVEEAALYGGAYSLSIVLTFALNAINNSYIPWVYRKMKEVAISDNRKVASALALAVSIILLMVIWLAPEIVLVIAGSNYLEAVSVMPPVTMSLLLLFYAQMFINIEFYYEQKKYLVISSIVSALSNIGLNFVFIPIFGYYAAGYTTLFSFFIFATGNYMAARIVLKKNKVMDSGFNEKQLCAILAIFVILGFLGEGLYDFFIIRLLFIFVFGILGVGIFIKSRRNWI